MILGYSKSSSVGGVSTEAIAVTLSCTPECNKLDCYHYELPQPSTLRSVSNVKTIEGGSEDVTRGWTWLANDGHVCMLSSGRHQS